MKTKVQKQEELARAKKLLEKSKSLVFADFTKIKAEDVRKLRRTLNNSNANFLVIKKRLLQLLLKEKGIESHLSEFKTSVGTVFSEGGIETGASHTFKFLSSLDLPEGSPRDLWIKHLLGGYDIDKKDLFDSAEIIMIGKLPSREILLSQLLGVMSGPIRSFMYVLDQKSKKVELTQASN